MAEQSHGRAGGNSERPSDLKRMTPRMAMDRYVDRRAAADNTSDATVSTYRRRLGTFVEWCEERGLMNVNDVDGRVLDDYWQFRRESLNDVSMKNEFGTLKKLFEYAVAIEAAEPDIPEKIALLKPTLSKTQRSNDEKIEPEQAQAILDWLAKFHYASRDHVMFALLWHTGCRTGGLRALDLDDVHADEQFVEFRHRPAEETPLKNEFDGERDVALSDEVARVVGDYIEENRKMVVDDYGREPFLTTERGRAAGNTIQRRTYALTQPCTVGGCPHDRDPDDCEWRVHGRESKCPSSLSPHRIRTGAISYMRECGMSISAVSDRVDATPETIRTHYDRSDPRRTMESRRAEVSKLD
ncbi:tyrosine-type recombinase/integrase [Halarchaeum salinum]|uniref:Tyrosine-type recombinase/integrase n=1 Tax=Halarchaeum salinum TaxID=489912 RepID=A0AAV3S987_9EURY